MSVDTPLVQMRARQAEAGPGLVEQAPAELEHDKGELASILHEMEKHIVG